MLISKVCFKYSRLKSIFERSPLLFLEFYLLCRQLVLQLLVLVLEASELELELLLGLVDLEALFRLEVYSLALELVAEFTLRIPC